MGYSMFIMSVLRAEDHEIGHEMVARDGRDQRNVVRLHGRYPDRNTVDNEWKAGG